METVLFFGFFFLVVFQLSYQQSGPPHCRDVVFSLVFHNLRHSITTWLIKIVPFNSLIKFLAQMYFLS